LWSLQFVQSYKHWQNVGFIFHKASQKKIREVSDKKIAVCRMMTCSTAVLSRRQMSIQERRHRFVGDVWVRSVMLKNIIWFVFTYMGH
jgi:hypothetical protein